MTNASINTLFVDIGGVLLTNGWDHNSRKAAAEIFHLDAVEMEKRHQMTFGIYEEAGMTLEEYLKYTVFYQQRSFSMQDFIKFMHDQSQPLHGMIDYVKQLKKEFDLRIVTISNEGRELAEYRNQTFHLTDFVDFFIISGFVYHRKPDVKIFRLALDMTQADRKKALYIDDRAIFIDVAKNLGIQGIHHTGLTNTQNALKEFFPIMQGGLKPAKTCAG